MISREIEQTGMPVAHITAMSMLANQLGANRVITGTKIPHPLGDPNLPSEADLTLRRGIIECALNALQTDVVSPTIFTPDIAFTSG